jgi:hypothetical protein
LAEKSIEAGNVMIDKGSDFWGGPELARLQADLLVASSAPVDTIDQAYLEALEKARGYPNKVYELRTACGLAEHYKRSGRAQQAAELIRSTCATVSEPCEIPDFVAARDLLSQITG